MLARVCVDVHVTPLFDNCVAYFTFEGQRLVDSLAGVARR